MKKSAYFRLFSFFVISMSVMAVGYIFAKSESIATTKVVILDADGGPTCETTGFDFGELNVDIHDQTKIISGVVRCQFLQGGEYILTYQLKSPLTSSSFTLSSGSLSIQAEDLSNVVGNINTGSSAGNYYSFSEGPITVYDKMAYTVGAMEQQINLKLNIPGGTPAGDYNGTMIFTILPKVSS